MTFRSALHGFYRRLQLANDLRNWKVSTTSNDEPILIDTDYYGVAEDWTEWETSSSID